MSEFSNQLYLNLFYHPFLSLLKFLESKPIYFYILIGTFIFLTILKGKIPFLQSKIDFSKHKTFAKLLPQAIDLIAIVVFGLILIVGYTRFSPAIADFLKPSDSTQTPTKSKPKSTTPTKTNTGTKNTTTPTYDTSTYQPPKQLYYSVSCSTCWNDACSHNGYNYGGYDYGYYYYYYNLCKSCSCNSFKAVSFWK